MNDQTTDRADGTGGSSPPPAVTGPRRGGRVGAVLRGRTGAASGYRPGAKSPCAADVPPARHLEGIGGGGRTCVPVLLCGPGRSRLADSTAGMPLPDGLREAVAALTAAGAPHERDAEGGRTGGDPP
ncbi:hypothetical protein [Streptomyces sp. NPDC059168]|uniref:hypothetical protein n=1 Tax=Streptomyces sp. NPDC059168 TaxID=3346753 RepID=UPI0036AB33E8